MACLLKSESCYKARASAHWANGAQWEGRRKRRKELVFYSMVQCFSIQELNIFYTSGKKEYKGALTCNSTDGYFWLLHVLHNDDALKLHNDISSGVRYYTTF